MRGCAALAVVLLLTTAGPLPAAPRQPDEVRVVNLPEIQRVEGTVALAGPPPQAKLVRLAQVVVAPVSPEETTVLVPGGMLVAEGFVSAALSVAGRMRADTFRPGSVGALLIPDQELLVQAFEETGRALLALRVEAEVAGDAAVYFASDQPTQRLAFPRYRVYFHNTTDRPAAVTLYAYLTN